MDNESRNSIYSRLTLIENEESATLNFFESLKYRSNGHKLVSILLGLNESDYDIVMGFVSNKITSSEALNSFNQCQLKVDTNKVQEVFSLVESHSLTDEVFLSDNGTIAIFVK